MTAWHPSPLTLTVEAAPASAVVRVAGDLDYDTCAELLAAVAPLIDRWLAAPSAAAELRLDLGRLGSVDSSGLSVLLLIRRRTDEARVRLHLDERPDALNRLLDVTGTVKFLTADRDRSGDRRGPRTG
ncbi:STAS domain-containing protein [Streptomyces sp. NPDC047000]|uniref:STAS domain-containing protein n=1 Tax=Streptomyces sp. NPDC047000 TaxID=3155474 RepID=UPI0033FCE9A0